MSLGLQTQPNLPWKAKFPMIKIHSQQPHITKLGVLSIAPWGSTYISVCTVHLYDAHTMYPKFNNVTFTLAVCETVHSAHSTFNSCIFYFFPEKKKQPGYDPLNWFHDPLTGHNLEVEKHLSSLLLFYQRAKKCPDISVQYFLPAASLPVHSDPDCFPSSQIGLWCTGNHAPLSRWMGVWNNEGKA